MLTKPLPLLSLCLALLPAFAHASDNPEIDRIVQPLMQKHAVPGMTIAVSVDGEAHFYNYGVASKQSQRPITAQTLFEIGSLSKTFTATLAAYAQNAGKINLTDSASHYLPELRGSTFDKVTLQNLATHTSGLPLFVPDDVTNTAQLMDYYKSWQPQHTIGSYRIYSNLGIGMLGMITAKSLNQPFAEAMEQRLLAGLGMKHSFVNVPPSAMADYAQGYDKNDRPVRVTSAPLDAESYGLKSSSGDLIRYLNANMALGKVDPTWQQALNDTHNGYYHASEFTQNMMWESYPYPVTLEKLQAGNDAKVILNGVSAKAITPPQPPVQQAWYNKTGSTNGFSTYAVFIPSQKIAVVMLANKNFPNDERVTTVYNIIQTLHK
ncbi:class C beta-lactamase [Serratia sp. NPDC078593]|uniref:class C beta-lactamase n=1 Tax=unclassified Serratia (in: enterobacteria) TaxID=2647522 RepID=UPI0037D7BF46